MTMVMNTHYNSALVALSITVAVFAAYVSLDLAGRQTNATKIARWAWLIAAAIAMGGGTWAMHFIGMLSLAMPMPVTYDVNLTLGSLVLPIAVTGGGLAMVGCRPSSWRRAVGGGLLMGAGIVLMHYLGMAAMKMPGHIQYDTGLVALSIFIAVVTSTAALRLSCSVQSARWRSISAVVMGMAVVGMHYVGMAAASIVMNDLPSMDMPWHPAIEPEVLALEVGGLTGVLLVLALTSSILDRRRAEREALQAYKRLNQEAFQAAALLSQSEERHRLAVLATGLGTWDWDLVSNTLVWSERTYILFGLTPGTSVDYGLMVRHLHPDDRVATELAVQRALDPNGCGSFLGEFRIIRPDGECCWLRSQGAVHFEDGGVCRRPVRFIGTLLDITTQRLADETLHTTLAEKDMLLREIHHRIKNNMQTISALVELEAAQVSDPTALEGFRAITRRIQAMARLHEHLYGTQDLQHIDLSAYLQDLGCGLAALHKGRLVSIQVDAEPLTCDLDVAMPIGLIATELVTNSLKHAFPEGRNGAIHIHLGRRGGDVWFEVADNGIGSHQQSRTPGMGKRLIEALVTQLGAELDVVRDGGYRTRLVVPVARFSYDG